MTHTCAYRYEGNIKAAEAAYEEWRETTMEDTGESLPEWDNANTETQLMWAAIFRAGHRAYRQVIREER